MRYLFLSALLVCSASCFAQSTSPKDTVNALPPPVVYQFVEQMPTPGFDIVAYLVKNTRYPENAKKNNVQGRVMTQFVVNEDGSLTDFKVMKSVGSGLDEEAVRLLKGMPKWKPGKQNGKAVRVIITQPITFRLE